MTNAYTSDNRVATSPTLSFTTGVIGAKDWVLVMAPEAAGPFPFALRPGIVFANCGGEERENRRTSAIPSSLLSIFD